MRRSERAAMLDVVTRGPPAWPLPLRYWLTTVESNFVGVVSKGIEFPLTRC